MVLSFAKNGQVDNNDRYEYFKFNDVTGGDG